MQKLHEWSRMDRLLWMHCYVRAVETGSFSAVARELEIGQPTVSRHIAQLEAHLGCRLLQRSTRRLSLTAEGERYYPEARRALEAVALAESGVQGEPVPQGLLRVTCPTALARFLILPLVTGFLRAHPRVDLDLQIVDRRVDLIEEGVDLAIRVGELSDSALHARRLALAPRVCVASPDYLARQGTPQRPRDLGQHNCVRYSLLSTGSRWPFETEPVEVSGNFRVNSPDGVREVVAAGLGIGLAPRWLFEDLLAQGRVLPLLEDHPLPPMPIHALYPTRRWLPPRAQVFIEAVARALRERLGSGG